MDFGRFFSEGFGLTRRFGCPHLVMGYVSDTAIAAIARVQVLLPESEGTSSVMYNYYSFLVLLRRACDFLQPAQGPAVRGLGSFQLFEGFVDCGHVRDSSVVICTQCSRRPQAQ